MFYQSTTHAQGLRYANELARTDLVEYLLRPDRPNNEQKTTKHILNFDNEDWYNLFCFILIRDLVSTAHSIVV